MKKVFIIILAVLAAIIGYYFYNAHQEKVAKQKFRKAFEEMPEKLKAEMPKNLPIKPDVIVAYPNVTFYGDVKGYREKTLPPEAEAMFNENRGFICESFYSSAIPQFLENKSDGKIFLKLVKEENISAEMQFRNEFGEVLFKEHSIIWQCPQYISSLQSVS
ncbi:MULTISPECIES: hypothetical protein [unclassified Acinetobacter]|uniref:hypothetical protein n=1 Tax=unclassified Acinetobacter TaxID=196816 RepID=UPI0035B90E20